MVSFACVISLFRSVGTRIEYILHTYYIDIHVYAYILQTWFIQTHQKTYVLQTHQYSHENTPKDLQLPRD